MACRGWRRWVLSGLAGACAAGAEAEGADACPSGAPGGSAAGLLRWRTVPYGDLPRVEYGGDLAKLKFQDAGFGPPAEDDDWDVLFTHDSMVTALASAPPLPKRRRRLANHCGYYRGAGHKCFFARHVHRVEWAFGRDDSSKLRHLLTYDLQDKEQAEKWREMARMHPERHWVIKGCTAGASADVRVVRGADEEALSNASGTFAVAQEYVHRPFRAFGGSKWFIRLYVLVTSWAPPRAFFYQEAYTKVKRGLYDASRPTQEHLFSRTSLAEKIDHGALTTVWRAMGLQRAAVAKERLRSAVGELLGTALRGSFGDFEALSAGRAYECFDLFGLDVIIGEDLEPHVLEVNQGPGLWGKDEEPTSIVVKGSLLGQVLAWAARKVRHPGPLSAEEEEAIENATLVAFTRVV